MPLFTDTLLFMLIVYMRPSLAHARCVNLLLLREVSFYTHRVEREKEKFLPAAAADGGKCAFWGV